MVEARIQPQDIESVRLGRLAPLWPSALNAPTTLETDGTVARISAGVNTNP